MDVTANPRQPRNLSRVAAQIAMETKPRVLIAPLCGPERSGWINPLLANTLVHIVTDQRFIVEIEFIFGAHGVDVARNLAVQKARQKNAEWVVMVDNDMTVNDPLGILTEAIANHLDIVAVSAGILAANGAVEPNVAFHEGRERCGNFARLATAGAGVLLIRRPVWEALPVLFEGNNEDTHFCKLAQGAGFKIWTHGSLAGHLHSIDLSQLVKGVRK